MEPNRFKLRFYLRQKNFGGNGSEKIWLMISTVINVLNFPIGTIIGVYAFWFVYGEEGKRYIRN